jgi:hypothetical protein
VCKTSGFATKELFQLNPAIAFTDHSTLSFKCFVQNNSASAPEKILEEI